MNRRQGLVAAVGALSSAICGGADFGSSKGFPYGWPPKNERGGQPMPWTDPDYLVGNFSGGIETIWPTTLVKKFNVPSNFNGVDSLPGPLSQRLKDLQQTAGKPAILVIRKGGIAYENYEFKRTSDMRFSGKSMSKSVLSLLVGICIKEGLIDNLNDPIAKYAKWRIGNSELGSLTLQNAMNMSGGANICTGEPHCKGPRDDIEKWGFPAVAGHPRKRLARTNIKRTLQGWSHGFKYPQGSRFEYNPIDPALVGLVVEGAADRSISTFMSEKLWIPMGAEADGSWSVDSVGHEIVDGTFAATLRDWGRLGLLVAQKGAINGNQIVPESYILDCRNTAGSFGYLAPGNIPGKLQRAGYKHFFHLPNDSKSWLKFQGAGGQTILCDLKTESVLVILSAANRKGFDGTYESIFSDIVKLS